MRLGRVGGLAAGPSIFCLFPAGFLLQSLQRQRNAEAPF